MGPSIFFTSSCTEEKKLLETFKKKPPAGVRFAIADSEDAAKRPSNSILVATKKDSVKYGIAGQSGVVIIDETKGALDAAKGILKLSYKGEDAESVMLSIAVFARMYYYEKKAEEMSIFAEAFEKVSELSRKELLTARGLLDAHDKILEYSRQEQIARDKINQAEELLIERQRHEKIDYEQTIKAKDQVSNMSRDELMMKDKIIKAWESFYNIARQELLDLRRGFNAQEAVIELSRHELQDNDQTIKAMNQAAEMSRQELIESKKEFSAQEQALELSRIENMNNIKNVETLASTEIEALVKNDVFWTHLNSQEKKDLVETIRNLLKSILKRRS